MKPIELREADFKKVIELNINYPKGMREDFFNYWSEPNPSGTKMKFELEKTWHLGRRLARWANNDFGRGKVEVKKEVKVEAENGFSEINKFLLQYQARPTNFKVEDFFRWYEYLKERKLLKTLSQIEIESIREAYDNVDKMRAAWVMKTFDWYGTQGFLFSDVKNKVL